MNAKPMKNVLCLLCCQEAKLEIDKIVTSLEKEMGRELTADEVQFATSTVTMREAITWAPTMQNGMPCTIPICMVHLAYRPVSLLAQGT